MHASSRTNPSNRRGVLLLVVLSMLTLFVLLGTTYVVLASRFRSTSRAFLKIADDQNTAPYAIRSRLRDAALQVIRGTLNQHSAVRFHDLLADKYGTSAENFNVANAALEGGGQFLRITLATAPSSSAASLILTFADAPDAPESIQRTSHRIIDTSGSVVYVLRPSRLSAAELNLIKKVWINGRDFSGAGFAAAEIDLPNWSQLTVGPSGSRNEAYDAVDGQNVAIGRSDGTEFSFVRRLSARRVIEQFQAAAGLATFDEAKKRVQELLNDAANRFSQAADTLPQHEREVLTRIRRATLRPFPYDHYPDPSGARDFAGRPISIDAILEPVGDVDNDGDGMAESVWLDLGLPPITLFDRTPVKPLFAIHCIDLDGRLNLNVHGSVAHLSDVSSLRDDALAHQPAGAGVTVAQKDALPLPQSRGLAGLLRAGLGFGPADVRLDSVIDAAQFRSVLLGSNAATGIGLGVRRDIGRTVGRYGDGIGSVANPPRPGRPGVADRRPGADRTIWPDRAVAGAFTGQADYWSRFTLGIDHRGQPYLVNRMQGQSVDDALDSPYEFDPTASRDANPYAQPGSPTAWVDQPFTPGEMEAVLRVFDSDNAATLPPRALTSMLASGQDNRNLVTTESWDTPAIVGAAPPGIPEPDLQNGLKMELNREFGDGQDNDGSGVVDEPGETSDPFAVAFNPANLDEGWWLTRGRTAPAKQPGPDLPGLRARQLMADDVFKLLQFLRQFTTAPTDDRSLAQWAINIVDFLDGDAVMTPFRYNPSGVGDQFVVWGCEQPDLIITETLAFHDRSIADTAHDDYKPTPTAPPEGRAMPEDQHFDQIQVPQGSLFVELQRVRGASAQRLPRELYDANGRLDLARVPGNAAGAAPVWRLSLTRLRNSEITSEPEDIQNYDAFRRNLPLSATSEAFAPRGQSFGELIGDDGSPAIVVDRYVWFTPNGPSNSRGTAPTTLPALPSGYSALSTDYPDAAPHQHNTFTHRGGDVLPLAGDFLVVGPRPRTVISSVSRTTAGKYGTPSLQTIELTPQVRVLGITGQVQPNLANPDSGDRLGDSLPPAAGVRPEAKACWCATPPPIGWTHPQKNEYLIGLNISERMGMDYYKGPPDRSTIDTATGRVPYGDPNAVDKSWLFLDETEDGRAGSPLKQVANVDDAKAKTLPAIQTSLLCQGSHLNAATVFLERLADPTRPHDPRAEMKKPGNPAETNPNWNPYVVVDFMPIDLTVFNGETNDAQRNTTPGQTEHDLPNKPFWFCTRQRGFDADFLEDTAADTRFKLSEVLFPQANPNPPPTLQHPRLTQHPWRPSRPWSSANALRPPVPPDVTAQQPVSGNANFLYEVGRFPNASDPLGVDDRVPTHSLGWVNQAYGRRLGPEVPTAYAGAPARPLPWITWNDRPFTSAFELLLVPRTAPGRLLTDYRSLNLARKADAAAQATNIDLSKDAFGAKTPGWHLMPLTSLTDYKDGSPSTFLCANRLGKIFSYVHVRSRFAGTSTVLDPGSDMAAGARTRKYMPPFNTVPTYREPGRININTIPLTSGAPIWNGLLGVPQPPAGSGPDAPWIKPDPAWADLGTRMAAVLGTARPALPLLDDGLGTAFIVRSGSTVTRDVFSRAVRNNVTNATSSHPAIDADTAWFRFEPLIRASTHATARSEVYAIWVTMGLFEVDKTEPLMVATGVTPSVERYPDGNRLVREYGSDTGQIERHRAFFLFDRSRPIGYQEGSDMNVVDGILVESYFD